MFNSYLQFSDKLRWLRRAEPYLYGGPEEGDTNIFVVK